MVDLGTSYGERVIAPCRSVDFITSAIETRWICIHGALTSFSSDPEFCRPVLARFLKAHEIKFRERPARYSPKNDRVERNNSMFKSTLHRMCKERTYAAAATIVASSSLVTNLVHGSSTMKLFQLTRGYSPSMLRIPSTNVPPELLDSHVEITSKRALQKLLKSRVTHTTPSSLCHQEHSFGSISKCKNRTIVLGRFRQRLRKPAHTILNAHGLYADPQ